MAVIEDARDLRDEEMQAIALQFNLSETTFVLPSTHATARVRMRRGLRCRSVSSSVRAKRPDGGAAYGSVLTPRAGFSFRAESSKSEGENLMPGSARAIR